MNSKERVRETLEGRVPDRVPWGEFAVDFDTVEKIIGHETYLRAKAKSKIAFWEGRREEVAESYLKDHIELHRALELDIVTFPMATWEIPAETDDPPPRKTDDSTWEDKYGRVYKYSAQAEDIVCVRNPVEESRTWKLQDFLEDPPPARRDPRSWKILDAVIQELKGEKFICSPSGGELGIIFLGGVETGAVELIAHPELVRAATSFFLRKQNLADRVMVHPDADAILWAFDFGHKTGPFISPAMFKDFFFEANKARVDRLHQEFGKKVILHCCGNVSSFLDFFIAIGFDAYQSIQGSAGMDICRLKDTHGDRLTLWGGVALENLIGGTPDDVRQDVRRAMTCAKRGGRFILGTSHSVAVGSRYDNFRAMVDEWRKWAPY